MRAITKNAVNSFYQGVNFKSSNTSVHTNTQNGVELRLHNNLIAYKKDGETYITNAGWMTTTTKERLNGLAGVSVCQRKGVWYLNGNEWDGSWVKV